MKAKTLLTILAVVVLVLVTAGGTYAVKRPEVLAQAYNTFLNVRVLNDLDVDDTLNVSGAATFGSTVTVTGAQTYTGALAANGGITVDSTNFTVSGTTGAVTTASTIGQTLVNAAGGSANPYDYTGTLGIMDGTGSDDFTVFDINITNADHTGGTVQVLDVANITGDANATETALKIGTGWDAGITTGSLANLDAGIAVDTNAFTVADTSGNTVIAGSLAANGGITVDSTAFTVADTSGNTVIAGTLAANGGISVDTTNFTVNGSSGAVATASTLSVGTDLTVVGDITVSPNASGGNAGARSQISGLPKIKMVALGTMTNGTTETTSYTDDSSTGEYAPIDGDVTEAEGSVAGIFRIGASSYAATFAATAAANDGFKRTIVGDDLEANESIGMWLYPTETVASGDLQILLTDDGGARNFNIGALTADIWQWVEIDISGLNGGTGDVVSEFGITLTAQGEGALAEFVLYMDGVWKWDADNEEALGVAILQDGVLSVMTIATDAGTANTPATIVEDTGFFVHYENGADFIVVITDQSAASGVALVAY